MLADEIPRMNRGMTVCGGMTVKQFVIPQRDLLLADEIPRMNRGMTVCGSMTVRGDSSSRYVLAGSRDTVAG
ncbi:hypothetical protein [Wolbachia endosymbiont of Aedes albopictus]|uniref:hypothetical protein n=1 Tax=Wolbachia endosymbiont of Aedes albopictus TaxID=167957 RepID=UPI00216813E6|nr:hypothetical protein [Wolbachia endosymbiont of Aedes albopictus]UVW84316.1 hypothetical protein NHG98_02305 [Wolbachia endosymbiont of Aedes albopictus]